MTTPDANRDLDHVKLYPLAEQVSRALEGAVFPLSRKQLVLLARENEAPSTLLTLFHGVPNREYRTLDGVQRAIEDIALAAVAAR